MKHLLILSIFSAILTTQVLSIYKEYYDLLGVNSRANPDEIKAAFRKLSREKHPDKNKDDPTAEETYAKINRAYNVLFDKEKRRVYDQSGPEGLARFESGEGQNWEQWRQQSKGNAPEAKMKIPLSLEDIYNGKHLKLFLTKQMICPHCRGSGADNPDEIKICPACNGQGMTIQRQHVGNGHYQQYQMQCGQCGGRGKTFQTRCHVCNGAKLVDGVDELHLHFEKGVKNGHKIIFPGIGNEYLQWAASDVQYEVIEIPHPVFVRKDNDLYTKVNITLEEALLGFSKTFKHLDKREITVESDSIVQPGQMVKIEGEGMPIHEYASQSGDLYVEYVVTLPTTFTDDDWKLVKKLFKKDD